MKKIIYFTLVCLVLGDVSCQKIVSGINTDPNHPTDAPVDLILTGAEASLESFYGDRSVFVGNMWCGYMTGISRQELNYQNYIISPTEVDGTWTLIYYNVIGQLKLSIQKYGQVNNKVAIGISQIMEALMFGTATTIYGDIPFSQAGNETEYPHPRFDPQLDVYDDVQALLDSGILNVNSSVGTMTKGTDIFFNGDPSKWVQVAHTLKARFYLDTRNYDSAFYEAKMGISSPNSSMLGPAEPVPSLGNPLYALLVVSRTGDIGAEGAYLTKLLDPDSTEYRGNSKTDEEARFHYYFVNLGSQGLTGGIEPNYFSVALGNSYNGIVGMDQPCVMVSYQENLLILAESAARTLGFDAGLSYLNEFREYMNSGGYISPSCFALFPHKYLDYSEPDFRSGGIVNHNMGDNELNALLSEILEERYVTFFGQLLGYSDIRRTQKEIFGVKVPPAIGNEIPQRIPYGQSEISSNPNVPNPLPGLFQPTPVNK